MPFVSRINLNGKVYDIKASGASSPVLGVKGEQETRYRTGLVNITKENLGLGNVPNFKPVSTQANQGLSDTEKQNARNNINALSTANKGVAGGIAELDSTGRVPSSQLPSFVDDVLEYTTRSAFPIRGENGKIYIATDTNKTYRWSGLTYTVIGSDLALGETSSTAYRGDRGKTAYDHSQVRSGNPHNVTKAEVGLSEVPNVSTNNQTPSYVPSTSLLAMSSGEKLTTAFGKIAKAITELINHIADKSNPHGVTAAQTGAATSNHTHTLTITSSSGTSSINLTANTTYKITAGGQEFIFKTPADNGSTYPVMTASELKTGTATALKVVRADYLHSGIQSMIDDSVGKAINASY